MPLPTSSGWRSDPLRWVKVVIIATVLLVLGGLGWGWYILFRQVPMDGITLVTVPAEEGTVTSIPAVVAKEFQAEQIAGSPTGVPAHLKKWVETTTQAPVVAVPRPIVQQGTRIIIPSINIDAPIGEGTDWESLKYKVGHHPGTANPGERGNMVLAAHNDVFGELFRYLPDVPVGEIITVYAGEQIYRYRITERRIVRPSQTEVMLPTTGPTITLISCYPYLIDTHRIVLFGELIG